MMKKMIISGGEGQLGVAFAKRLQPSYHNISYSKKEMDITNPEEVDKIIKQNKPDYLIHCAAYTDVDQCENMKMKAFQVNTLGSLNIAKSCKSHKVKLVYISSDYVFDGESNVAYSETSKPNPKNTYGLSKWLGEEVVLKTNPESYIVRTSWLYGHGGKNFVRTIWYLAKQGQEVSVVSDQIGSPTYAEDLVEKCLEIFESPYGIYHISNQGKCSWYDLARVIYQESGTGIHLVKPVLTKDYQKTSVPRPFFSALKMERLKQLNISLPCTWKKGLTKFMGKEKL
ncbi:dTDP-4-dehydrorhamnose reductase [Virgibacillus salexigens]|uniref:dTDP-4-dehydrorhamnose reductase n=1 Tax=Virgibacillus salexigens TaxID=61016 RepID=UPI00190DDE31|nr:dTDP-4-dehydrorhamnose reductase [Virgibacillus salexigens]